MTGSSTEHDETTRTEQLRSVYLSVTGDAEPVVESQQEDSPSREIQTERASEAVGPAELHGLDDAIDDPGPSD
ncbi:MULTISPECIES: hypothetical protein [Natronorubrum]|uniref:Uncharacterized protein n=2 Tax=Natronorubrum bangense TaxID=61858 RepID=L9W664_9EURY|nr:hypothetical protein [Natronorubrum bangense]ELY44847.1 hypothetical protein C494_16328 [Natronorubrum bangense JCM 10635]QCC56885.1 hypothetical protein DV706_20355 [Natronorubrum bangense]